ncbi:PTS sugar transporter subunit IIA [Uliginosibacterium sp. sgz301328]|uniref:PTS sugar transporter subunit IIA n=1 Tax=Uliginosibacterium sp. sgz301328 TaxID=3243764 RepID=UPI00359D69F9
MNLISNILPLANIAVDVQAASKSVLFELAARLFETEHGLSAKTINNALTQREKLGSTGLGQGIAIPHGRIKGLKESRGAFFRTVEPIGFDAPDGKPVNLIFFMLVPEQANESHLRLLSELAQMFSDRTFRDDLIAAPDAAAVQQLFNDWNANAANERRAAI